MAIDYKFEFDGELLMVTTSGKDESMDDVLNYSKAILEKA